MLHHLQDQLLAMIARDTEVRAALEADGTLFEGYHPLMEEVHRNNAARLRQIIEVHSWPDEELVGPEAAEAAWLVVQHSISEPSFMRHCRSLIDKASCEGRIPRWQFAYLDDRIRVLEGKTQRFGTQFESKPDGPTLNKLEDSSCVDGLRSQVGLGPISEVLSRAQESPRPSVEEYEAKQIEAKLWRRKIGWVK